MRKLFKTSVNIVLCTALMIALSSTAVAQRHNSTQPSSTSEALDFAHIQNIPFFVTFFAPVSTTNSDRYGWLFARHGGFEFRYHDVAFDFEIGWFRHTNTTINCSHEWRILYAERINLDSLIFRITTP